MFSLVAVLVYSHLFRVNWKLTLCLQKIRTDFPKDQGTYARHHSMQLLEECRVRETGSRPLVRDP